MDPSRFFRDRRGRLKVAQPPNPAVATAIGLAAAQVLSSRPLRLRLMARGALTAWAADEGLRGASPFRRTLGAAVLALCLSPWGLEG